MFFIVFENYGFIVVFDGFFRVPFLLAPWMEQIHVDRQTKTTDWRPARWDGPPTASRSPDPARRHTNIITT